MRTLRYILDFTRAHRACWRVGLAVAALCLIPQHSHAQACVSPTIPLTAFDVRGTLRQFGCFDPATGTTSVSGASFGSGGIDPTASPYNAKFDVIHVTDASITTGTPNLTCPNNDCRFTAGAVGKAVKLTNLGLDISAITSVNCLPAGTTISAFISATAVTLSQNSTCGTLTANGTFAYGTDDNPTTSGPLSLAANAARDVCGTLLIPAGRIAFFSRTWGNTTAACTTLNGLVQARYGWNITSLATGPSAYLIPLVGFPSTDCTGPNGGGVICIAAGAGTISNVSFDGMGDSALGAGFSGKIGIQPFTLGGSNPQLVNMELSAWGTATAGFIGEVVTGSGAQVLNVQNDGWGGLNCQFSSAGIGLTVVDNSFCAVGIQSLQVTGGFVSSSNSIYGFTTGISTDAVQVLNGATLNTVNDTYPYLTASGRGELGCGAGGGFLNVVNANVNNPTAASYGIVANSSGTCAINLEHTTVVGALNSIFLNAAAIYNDNCGNTITGAMTTTAGSTVNVCPTGASTYSSVSAGQLNCASSASPAVCSKYATGSVAIPAASATLVVNTTAVKANSTISIIQDQGLGTKLGVTCNTQSSLVLGDPRVTARTAGTSFTIGVDTAPTTNPICINYWIMP